MATGTYTALATTILPGAANSVVFSSIPTTDGSGNTIRDLILVMEYNASSSAWAGKVYINGDTTSSNYYWCRLAGNGASVTGTAGESSSIRWDVQTTANAMTRIDFLDAKATDKHKTVIVRADSAADNTQMSVNTWRSTAAVTSLTVQFGTSLGAGSTLSLYGVIA